MKLRQEGSPIFPSVRIAQALLETGGVIHPWNNLVGFKVGRGIRNEYWKGHYVNKGTWEVYDGKRQDVTAAFRVYDTVEECFRDQDLLFTGWDNYLPVIQAQTAEEQCRAFIKCQYRYATDPNYPQKLLGIIASFNLIQYDKEAEQSMLNADVANTIIHTWMSPSWHDADAKRKEAEAGGNAETAKAYQEQADYIHWLANELRKASRQTRVE